MGCFAVPMIHSTFLIDLRKEASTKLMFYPPHQDYTWSFDDIMVFAFSSRQAGTGAVDGGGFASRHAELCLEFRGQKAFVDFSCQFVPRSPPPLGGLPGSSYRDKVCVAPTLHLCHSKAASYILQLGCLWSPLQEAP